MFYSDLEYEFNAQPSDVTAVAGRATSLHCRPPTSFPPANVTWYKDGAMLRLSARSRLFPAEIERSGDLRFVNVQLLDSGKYVCVASNDFASRARVSTAPATLTVLGKNANHVIVMSSSLRPMSHLRFCHETLSRNLVVRQNRKKCEMTCSATF